MWNQFECMFHILAPFFDGEFRLRLCVTCPAHGIWNNRLANNGTNTARNEFGLVITTLTMLYAVKRYWNKNINIEIPFFQRFPKAFPQIYTYRLMLLVFQCMRNMLERSFLLENKTRNKIADIAFGDKFCACFLV